jgi:hypothetical protein
VFPQTHGKVFPRNAWNDTIIDQYRWEEYVMSFLDQPVDELTESRVRECCWGVNWRTALGVMALLLAMLGASGCDTKNVGTLGPSSQPHLEVTLPAAIYGGEDATWTVAWGGGIGPYTVEFLSMGGGANPNAFTGTANTSPYSHVFTMVNPSLTAVANYTYSIKVTSANGLVATATGAYTVGATRNQQCAITSATLGAGGVISVVVTDPNNDPITVTAAVGATDTITVAPATRNATTPYPATVTFTVSPVSVIDGGSGTVHITATDGITGHTPDTADVTVPAIAGIPLNADTLYVLPLASTAAVGEPVTITVAMGTPANKFLYMNAVGVTFQGAVDGTGALQATGGQYVAKSFDVGAPDDTPDNPSADPVDGVWSTLGLTSPDVFLFGGDSFVARSTDIGGGRVRMDFNVTPVVPPSTEGKPSGALFNFKLAFGAAGTYTLGLQQFETVDRCFYSGGTTVTHTWGHLMADAAGILDPSVVGINNTIVVE